jgi:hypothetical protein
VTITALATFEKRAGNEDDTKGRFCTLADTAIFFLTNTEE